MCVGGGGRGGVWECGREVTDLPVLPHSLSEVPFLQLLFPELVEWLCTYHTHLDVHIVCMCVCVCVCVCDSVSVRIYSTYIHVYMF